MSSALQEKRRPLKKVAFSHTKVDFSKKLTPLKKVVDTSKKSLALQKSLRHNHTQKITCLKKSTPLKNPSTLQKKWSSLQKSLRHFKKVVDLENKLSGRGWKIPKIKTQNTKTTNNTKTKKPKKQKHIQTNTNKYMGQPQET